MFAIPGFFDFAPCLSFLKKIVTMRTKWPCPGGQNFWLLAGRPVNGGVVRRTSFGHSCRNLSSRIDSMRFSQTRNNTYIADNFLDG